MIAKRLFLKLFCLVFHELYLVTKFVHFFTLVFQILIFYRNKILKLLFSPLFAHLNLHTQYLFPSKFNPYFTTVINSADSFYYFLDDVFLAGEGFWAEFGCFCCLNILSGFSIFTFS